MSIYKFDEMPLYQQLKCVRHMNNLTQAQLVEMLGLPDVPTLSRIERGEVGIPLHHRKNIREFVFGSGEEE